MDSIGTVEKDEMRDLILLGGPWSDAEREAILDYCESDVEALARLLPAMLPQIDLPAPCFAAVTWPQPRGWNETASRLILIRLSYYGGIGRTFKINLSPRWTATTASMRGEGSRWTVLRNGYPATTFRGRVSTAGGLISATTLSGRWPARTRSSRRCVNCARPSQMRLSDLPVGKDGRNRTMLSAFRARTGRNQPSNTEFIFGPSVWLRGLIQPPPGYGIAYIDWAQQEFGIAAALSGDPLMMDAYRSGDPYLAFAKQAGAAPPDATKATHKAVRDQFKSRCWRFNTGWAKRRWPAHRATAHSRAGAAALAPRNLSSVLAVVRRGC